MATVRPSFGGVPDFAALLPTGGGGGVIDLDATDAALQDVAATPRRDGQSAAGTPLPPPPRLLHANLDDSLLSSADFDDDRPQTAAAAADESERERLTTYRCAKCHEDFGESLQQLELHITVTHLQWVPYECLYCSDTFKPTAAQLSEHVFRCHPNKQPKIVMLPDAKKQQLLRKLIDLSTIRHGDQDRAQTAFDSHDTETDYRASARSHRLLNEDKDWSSRGDVLSPLTVTTPCANAAASRRSEPFPARAASRSSPRRWRRRSEVAPPPPPPFPPRGRETTRRRSQRLSERPPPTEANRYYERSPTRSPPPKRSRPAACRQPKIEPREPADRVRAASCLSRPFSPIQPRDVTQEPETEAEEPVGVDVITPRPPPAAAARRTSSGKRAGPPKFVAGEDGKRRRNTQFDMNFCKLCNNQPMSRRGLAHIFEQHLRPFALRCNYCDYSTHYRKHAILAHIQSHHKGRSRAYTDETDKFHEQIEDWRQRCFGTDGGDGGVEIEDEARAARFEHIADTIESVLSAVNAGNADSLAWRPGSAEPADVDTDEEVQPGSPLRAVTRAGRRATVLPRCPSASERCHSAAPSDRRRSSRGGGGGGGVDKCASINCGECAEAVQWIYRKRHVVARHLNKNTFVCRLCGWSSGSWDIAGSKLHAKRKHNIADVNSAIDDHRADLELDVADLFEQCFGGDHQGAPPPPPSQPAPRTPSVMYETDLIGEARSNRADVAEESIFDPDELVCNVCQQSVEKDKMSAHVYEAHIQKKLVACRLCSFSVFSDRDAVKQHVARAHPGSNQTAIMSRKMEFRQEYCYWRIRCFPK